MKRPSFHGRGFTLLEVMIAAAIGVIVLAVGLVAGMQMQRRALFEEQTMMAQVTGRAVKDLVATELQRAGLGMGNARISFGGTNVRYPIQMWTEPDLSQAGPHGFGADPGFALPPTGTIYADLDSDVLRLYWGDTQDMVVMNNEGLCSKGIREGVSANFCYMPGSSTGLEPPNGQTTPAILVNPDQGVACSISISRITNTHVNGNPGEGSVDDTDGDCARNSSVWGEDGWLTMRALGSAYRVNWAGGTPVLEYQAPGTTTWVAMSRDVERMKVRLGVADLTDPTRAYEWFPSETHPSIDQCARNTPGCAVTLLPGAEVAPVTDEDHRYLLWKRVREVEVSLTIRTRRPDRELYDPTVPVTTRDEEGFPVDGFKRRTYTFRVTPRNFAAGGLQAPQGT